MISPQYVDGLELRIKELTEHCLKVEAERDAAARKHFLYGYAFCRANGFLFDDQLQDAADEYVRRQSEEH